jgi:hypothetical protein
MTHIIITFERPKLEAVTRAFSYLVENYSNREIVDWAIVLNTESEVTAITQKLLSCLKTHDDPVRVPMDRSDFYKYMNLVMFTPRILPPELYDDIDVLESLEEEQNWDRYEKILTARSPTDENGFDPKNS